MKRLLVIACLFSSYISSAQSYLVKYNMITDQSAYYRISGKQDTVRISKLLPKHDSRVELQVENFNPFYWKAQVTREKRNAISEGNTTARTGLFNFLLKGFNSFLPKNFPALDIPGFVTRGGTPDDPRDRFLWKADLFRKQYDNYRFVYEKFSRMDAVIHELAQLQHESKKDATYIKNSARAAIKDLVPVNDPSAESFVLYADIWQHTIVNAKDSMLLLADQLIELSEKIGEDERLYKQTTAKEILSETKNAKSFVDSVDRSIMSGAALSDKLLKIGSLYITIIETPFIYRYSFSVDGGLSDLKLELYPADAAEIRDTVRRYFSVETKALKLRSATGISFAHFPANYRSYYVKQDSTIGKQNGDLFSPVLTTFLHFYGSGSASLKVGGSVGFGIPLTGEQKDLHFMLGLSAIIGRNESLIFSAGVAGTKVNKLKSKYAVGDKVAIQDMNSLTRQAYDVGFFLGLSLNLGALSNQGK